MERFFSYAAEWSTFKADVLAAAAIDRGAAHVLLSVVALVALALVMRRPLWSWIPWAGVLVLQLLNEAISGYADRVLEPWELRGSIADVLLVMALPSFLVAACRFAPSLLRPRPIPIQGEVVGPDPRSETRAEQIEDAEFEEVEA